MQKLQRCKNETLQKSKDETVHSFNHKIELQWDSAWSRPWKLGCFVGLPRRRPHQRPQTGLSKWFLNEFSLVPGIDWLIDMLVIAPILNQVRREEEWREEPEEICRLAFLSEKILHGGWMIRNILSVFDDGVFSLCHPFNTQNQCRHAPWHWQLCVYLWRSLSVCLRSYWRPTLAKGLL